jgi:superfamily II RNA helicase
VVAPPKRTPVAVAPKPPITATPAEPVPVPRLGQIFTQDQQREYTRTLEEALERVRKQVAAIERRSLNADQNRTLETIRTFQKQAEQAREEDLLTAVNLARRADLLAKDLLGRLP